MSSVVHKGINIVRAEIPGALWEWVHDETNAHGCAQELQQAKDQIDVHLGDGETILNLEMGISESKPKTKPNCGSQSQIAEAKAKLRKDVDALEELKERVGVK